MLQKKKGGANKYENRYDVVKSSGSWEESG